MLAQHPFSCKIDSVEFVSQAAQLDCCPCSEQDFDCAGKYVECLYCLCLNVFMSDERSGFLRTAEQYVDQLLCFN